MIFLALLVSRLTFCAAALAAAPIAALCALKRKKTEKPHPISHFCPARAEENDEECEEIGRGFCACAAVEEPENIYPLLKENRAERGGRDEEIREIMRLLARRESDEAARSFVRALMEKSG